MARKMKCVYNTINGERTGVYCRTGMSRTYPSPGILFKYKCPDGASFLVNPDDGNGYYYDLIDPPAYGLPNQKMYAYIDDAYLVSRTIIDDTPPPPPPPAPEPYRARPLTNVNGLGDLGKDNNMNTNINGSGKSSLVDYDVNKIINASHVTTPVDLSGEGARVNFKTYEIAKDFENYKNLMDAINVVGKNANLITSSGLGKARYGIVDLENNMMTKFNRYKLVNPVSVTAKTFPHVFFTRPDLNIIDKNSVSTNNSGNITYKLHKQAKNDPNLYYIHKNSPNIILNLSASLSTAHDFSPYLSSNAKSFELSDESVKNVEVGETYTGHKVKYARHNIESKTAGSFSVSYDEDDNVNVYKIHKIWTDYMSKVYRGEFKPESSRYRKHKELDYAASAYYFLLGADGETIIFWSKYYGVFPSNVPSSSYSWSKGNNPSMIDSSITYEYAWKVDFDPVVLAEFNINSNSNSKYASERNTKYYRTYENETRGIGRTYSGAPFIETVINNVTNSYDFKLRFKANK